MAEKITDFFSGSETTFGIFYPTGYVLALVPNLASAQQAVRELVRAGFSEHQAMEFSGEEFLALVDRHERDKGMWAQMMESLSRLLGTEAVYVDHDRELAQRGAAMVAVKPADEAQKRQAATVLGAHQPLAMRFYTRGGIEVLEEHHNLYVGAQHAG